MCPGFWSFNSYGPKISVPHIGSEEELRAETTAWYNEINSCQRGVDWQMKFDDARIKLRSIYPKFKL